MAAPGPEQPAGGDPAGDWLAQLRLGTQHLDRREHAQAILHLEQALALRPEDPDALCMLGIAMHDLRRFDEAARFQERALALRPAFAEALYNLGLARFEQSDLAAALAHLRESYALKRGAASPRFDDAEMAVNEMKLRHDCEQLEYLLAQGRLKPDFAPVLAEYRALLAALQGTGSDRVIPFDAARYPRVARTYKRPLHLDDTPGGPPLDALLDPRLDAAAIEARYRDSRPNVVVVDGVLAPRALQALRRFCLESTIWNNVQAGYLGAYMYDGFCSAPLLRLAAELRERLPGIFRGLPLQTMWGYKYDCTLPGIGVHADAAAVNLNLWLTEDEANLDPSSGGLLVYTRDAPRDWGFEKYNRDPAAILAYLESIGSEPLRIPYRANRAVIFDSDLFHATDTLRFKPGYLNRRVNITLLYGLP